MNAHLAAALETAGVAFLAGFLKALEPYLGGTVPAAAQWGSILTTCGMAGLAYAWARWKPAPGTPAPAAKVGS